jgi:hypothetical protein
MKVGLIQSRGFGDIIIALPLAKCFVDQGHHVAWPIHEEMFPSFSAAAPYVDFIPIKSHGLESMYEVPLECLKGRGCERIIPLYSELRHRPDVAQKKFADRFRFDEYKYAIAGVPFREKWRLQIVRNHEREERLFRKVVRSANFVACHLQSGNMKASVDMQAIAGNREIVEITGITDNIFDWLLVIERASLRIMIDSCFSNLTEQLQISGPKIFIRRSGPLSTPVLLSDWVFAGY